MTDEADRARAGWAAQILSNPLWQEALGDLERSCVRMWREGTTPDAREEAWHRLRAADYVRKHFERAYKRVSDEERS